MPNMTNEDRSFGTNQPCIDLTPLDQWGPAIVNQIGKSVWAAIEEHVAARVDHACELCGASASVQGVMGRRANKFKTEMRFSHDEANGIASLRRLVHVCVPCWQAIHLRQTELVSQRMDPHRSPLVGAVERLKKFHGMSDAEVQAWLVNELNQWGKRMKSNYPQIREVGIVEAGITRLWR